MRPAASSSSSSSRDRLTISRPTEKDDVVEEKRDGGDVTAAVPRLAVYGAGRVHEIERFSHYVGTYVRFLSIDHLINLRYFVFV
jgi:hypothetical protein